MDTLPKISDSEWEVMKLLWEQSPSTSSEIIERLSQNTKWKPTTIKTLIRRLVKKKAIGFDDKNRTYYYYPLVKKEKFIRSESRSFLKKVYDGGLKAMFANFLEIEDLSKEDIEELKDILDEKKD
ncbi:BlaI/MecI/CopY family transcriptional regulator [Dethiothermospora halolimnae]|uniref:BlaI/MecI/CopY family transcriptional regulator n=1 Tax=Dethiothermospora halolimnae TaxID=3114390 RepID=UPI003CCB9483